MHKLKNIKILIIFFILITILGFGYKLYTIYELSKLPKIFIENHTDKILRVANFQYTSFTEEPSENEMSFFKEIYRIDALDTQTYELRKENINKNPNYLVISYYSTTNGIDPEFGNDTTKEPIDNHKNDGRLFFSSTPKKQSEKSYCSFKVDLYENKKRIITPLPDDNSCQKRLYYYGTDGFW